MPQKVDHWLRVMDRGSPRLKALMETAIITHAQNHLGDYRNKLYLSLPPESLSRGSINLGNVIYEKERWPFGISTRELTQNLAIFGRSGAGKTNAAFNILNQLVQQNIPFLFLDWKRTARHLIPSMKEKLNIYTPGRSLSPFPFNPFVAPPGLEEKTYLNHVIDVMADSFTLGDGVKRILQKAFESTKGRSVEELIKAVEDLPDQPRVREWKISTLRALETIQYSEIVQTNLSQDQMVKKLAHQNTIIELDALPEKSKKFLIPLLCLWLYYVKMLGTKREELELVVFVEEAHHILYRSQHSKESLMNQLLRQCREMGMAFIVIDQHPHLISNVVLGNCYTSICLNQKDPADIQKAAGISLVPEDQKQHISKLKTGTAIVKLQDRWIEPVLIQIPHIEIQKGFITDDLLIQYLKQNKTLSRKIRRLGHKSNTIKLNPGIVISKPETLPFLQDVLEYPHSGVNERYKRTGLSTGVGYRLYQYLLDQGLLEDSIVEVGNTRKVILRLTQHAKQLLGIDEAYHGGLVHEFWKRFYCRLFRSRGYKVELEAESPGGPIDLLVQKDQESIAVEIETGKSDVVRNVSQALRNGHTALVVATDRKAFQKVQRRLTEASLWPSQNVRIVLRDKLEI